MVCDSFACKNVSGSIQNAKKFPQLGFESKTPISYQLSELSERLNSNQNRRPAPC